VSDYVDIGEQVAAELIDEGADTGIYRNQGECLGVVRESPILGMTRDSVSRTT
jgi:hypothetical protein